MGWFDFFKKKRLDSTGSITLGGKTVALDDNLKKRMALENEALSAYYMRQYSKAIALFGQIIDLAPNEAMYYTRRGTVYEDMGNDSSAERDFNKAVELAPDDYLVQFRLGMLYQRKNDLEIAILWLRKSYENKPTYESLMGNVSNSILFVNKRVIAYNLGNFLIQLGRIDEGMELIDEVIANCPDYSYPYFVKGVTIIQEGRFDEGLGWLHKASSLGHPHAAAAIQTVKLAKQQSFLDDALNDRYAELVDNTDFNPFNIVTSLAANQHLNFGDLTSVFRSEIENICLNVGGTLNATFFYRIVCGYTCNMIESYYKRAGYVPKLIMDRIIDQVYKSSKSCSYGEYLLVSFEDFKYKMYFDLTHR